MSKRISFTVEDEEDIQITSIARDRNTSKDRLIRHVVSCWLRKPQSELIAEKYDLKMELDKAYKEIESLRQQLEKKSKKKHNERGAGRKQVFGDAHKFAMQSYKANGMSYRQIAKIYNCSVGTVYKLINEQ